MHSRRAQERGLREAAAFARSALKHLNLFGLEVAGERDGPRPSIFFSEGNVTFLPHAPCQYSTLKKRSRRAAITRQHVIVLITTTTAKATTIC